MKHLRNGFYSLFAFSLIFLFLNSSDFFAYGSAFQIHMTPGASLGGCELTYTCYDMVYYEIHPGNVVTWINYDSTAHTVVSDDPFDGYNINSGNIAPGDSFTQVFLNEGYVMYHCQIHPWMEATISISVKDPPDTKPPPTPIMVSPVDKQIIADNTPTFDWTDTADVNAYYTEVYDLIVDNDPGFATAPEIYQAGLFKSEFTALTPLPDGTYYWKVRSADGGSNIGNYGPVFSFTLNTVKQLPKSFPILNRTSIDVTPPAAPLLTLPSDNSATTDTTPMFDWSDVTDPSMPVTYTLLVDDNPTFSSPEIDISGLTSSNYTPQSPLAVDDYYWKVRAYDNPGNTSPDSSVFAITISVATSSAPDFDGDGVPDSSDNCISVSNPTQKNTDGDAQGDACDTDDDNDGIVDSIDTCPLKAETFNGYQDTDGCPDTPPSAQPSSQPSTTPSPSPQVGDFDNDSKPDSIDNCVLVSNPDQKNTDGDALGDICDPDDDNDGVLDTIDACPTESETFNAFEDEDGCPDTVPTSQQPQTGSPPSSQPSQTEPDFDSDTIPDSADNCVLVSNPDQKNTDGDALGDACDTDDDNDGVVDSLDKCPTTDENFNGYQDSDGCPDTVHVSTSKSSVQAKSSEVRIPIGTGVPGCEKNNQCYSPFQVTIAKGDEVIWTNSDNVAHTVTSGDADEGPDGLFNSNLFKAGESFSFRFNDVQPGAYPYFCMIHPWMSGVILLQEGLQNGSEETIIQEETDKDISLKETEPQGETGPGGCLIATATFGSELAPQVQLLRETRDNTILTTKSGQAFMSLFNEIYYSFSPTIADLEREYPLLKESVKIGITPMLATLSVLNYVDIDSEEEILGYGIGVILLNIGIYFALPIFGVLKLRKIFN